ncbi:unnamed protein product [Effrenium voratum]|nr:unnamed protein product [Effrenium voratum]
MLIVGYSDRQKVFIIRNSWGTSWGDGGYGYVPYDYICNDDFNFLGQYAIMGLTDMDFTVDNADDKRDFNIEQAEPDEISMPDLETYEDEPEEDREDEFDAEDQFNAKNEAARVFGQFDFNKDGTITTQEMVMCFLFNGIRMDPRKLQKILSDCDFDHDGKFTFDEFWAVMATVKGAGAMGAGPCS